MTNKSLRETVETANELYRDGKDSGLTDAEYDALLLALEDDELSNKVGHVVSRSKKELPIPMGSLNKCKTANELTRWIHPIDVEDKAVVLTPKFDGISILLEYVKGFLICAYTRGDGFEGQDITSMVDYNPISKARLPEDFTGLIVAEAIMPIKTFNEKYAGKYKNPRNLVAGALCRKTPTPEVGDISIVAFGAIGFSAMTKVDQLDFCNDHINEVFGFVVDYILTAPNSITDDNLPLIYEGYSQYECDGIVIEFDNPEVRASLGLETGSLNPRYARAWKPESKEQATCEVEGITWQVSKTGAVKPVVNITPVELGGVTISNVTGINAAYILESGIDVGAFVTIVRSGDVIPKIIGVPVKVHVNVPVGCPCCTATLSFGPSQVDLICVNPYCKDKVIATNTDFFRILGADDIGTGVITQLYEAGYETIESLVTVEVKDLVKLDGFQERKANRFVYNVKQCLDGPQLSKLQHASNLFKGLGSRKLELLSEYNRPTFIPSYEDLIKVDGYSDISARSYLDGIYSFWRDIYTLPGLTIAKPTTPIRGEYTGKAFVFSGFRDAPLEELIRSKGGHMSGLSKRTHMLVVKDSSVDTTKTKKAKKLDVMVISREDLFHLLED